MNLAARVDCRRRLKRAGEGAGEGKGKGKGKGALDFWEIARCGGGRQVWKWSRGAKVCVSFPESAVVQAPEEEAKEEEEEEKETLRTRVRRVVQMWA
jgi:hypothetical protein